MKTYEAGESIHQINAGISHPSTFTAKKLLIYEQNYSFFETICVNVYQVGKPAASVDITTRSDASKR